MSDLRHVKGWSEIAKFLDTLPHKLQRNVARGSLTAGAKIIADAARSNAPVGAPSSEGAKLYGGYAGALRDSIRIRRMRITGPRVTVRVSAGGKSAKSGADTFYATWAEYGTRPHTITAANRKGLSVGGLVFQSVVHPGARPHPFMRPALDTAAGAAVVAAGEYMRLKLATKHGLDTADIVIEEVEGE